ncbi:MAG TPA: winged helix-turn-helix transcriptional regulator [Solirubrobacterales bacterium]|nr:winged helix-turn-helix transcriptional regulator [Solirubrobacterales bacterium]
MTTGLSGIDDLHPSEREDACLAGASTAEVLRLLSAGATGAILMALGEGPLRTKTLTEQVPGYAPRTIYRYAGKLAELEVVEREEESGVPSKVVHTLSDPCGTELYTLVNRFADASLTRLPDGRIDAHAWASLGLLADMWEAGMVEDLSCEGRSPTDLARGHHGLSYHQVNRRAGLFKTGGLLEEWQGPGRRRCYGLTEKTRRKMGLIAGIARWRHHHVVAEDEEGMTAEEMATVIRVTLPLVRQPDHRGKCLQLSVLSEDAAAGSEGETVWAEVNDDGSIHSCAKQPADPDAWGRGKVEDWIPVFLDGESSGILVGDDDDLVGDSVSSLFEVLWSPQPF